MFGVIGLLKPPVHQAHCRICRYNEENLHDGVVRRDVNGEQVQVARGEDQSKQDLSSS